MSEATLEGGVPTTAGWFVVNARDARWSHALGRCRATASTVGILRSSAGPHGKATTRII